MAEITSWDKIMQTQQTLDQTFKTLKESFEKAELAYKQKQLKIMQAFETEQRKDAEVLSQIGKALELMLNEQQV